MRKPEVVDMATEWGKHLKSSRKKSSKRRGSHNRGDKRIYHHSRRMKLKEHDRNADLD